MAGLQIIGGVAMSVVGAVLSAIAFWRVVSFRQEVEQALATSRGRARPAWIWAVVMPLALILYLVIAGFGFGLVGIGLGMIHDGWRL